MGDTPANTEAPEESDTTVAEQNVFIAPAQAKWWKFTLAGLVWKLTRGNPIPGIGHIPGTHKAAMWAFKVLVMSRDFETTEVEVEKVYEGGVNNDGHQSQF